MPSSRQDPSASPERLVELESALLQLSAAEELTGVGSFSWEIPSDEVRWSWGLCRIFGIDPEQFGGTFDAYLELVHEDDREERRGAVERLLRGGEHAEDEHRIRRTDGSVRWLSTVYRLVRDEAGEPLQLIGACQDVTEARESRLSLEREIGAVRYRALQDPLTGLANRALALARARWSAAEAP